MKTKTKQKITPPPCHSSQAERRSIQSPTIPALCGFPITMASFITISKIILTLFSLYYPIAGPTSPFLNNTFCKEFFYPELITLSVVFSLQSILSLLNILKRSPMIRKIFVLLVLTELLFMLITELLAFGITQTSRTHPNPEEEIYKLSDYSDLYRNYLSKDGKNWDSLRHCIRRERICEMVNKTYFHKEKPTPIKLSCCMPPSCCGFISINGTNWVPSSLRSSENDCQVWSNDIDKLCYGCESCMAGFMEAVRTPWRNLISSSYSTFFWAIVVQYLLSFTGREKRKYVSKK